MGEDVGDLLVEIVRHTASVRRPATDDAGHKDITHPAGVGDRVGVAIAVEIDALALDHGVAPLRQSDAALVKTGAFSKSSSRAPDPSVGIGLT